MNQSSLGRLNKQILKDLIGTRSFGICGLAEGTNVHTVKTTAAVTYTVKGKKYSFAATDNIAMGTTQYFKDGTTGSFAVQADLTTRYYSVGVNAAGTVLMLQGPVVGATPPAIGAFDGANGKLPDTPFGCALLGYMKIVMSGGTFTMGTTDLSGTGVTATFEEWGLEPDDADVA